VGLGGVLRRRLIKIARPTATPFEGALRDIEAQSPDTITARV
jgi:hypothetical protein